MEEAEVFRASVLHVERTGRRLVGGKRLLDFGDDGGVGWLMVEGN